MVLRSKNISRKITEKLESVEITAQGISDNLNALMLVENESCSKLLSIFIEHRKEHCRSGLQTSAMVRCLITTVHILHDCFICTKNEKKGLIWQQLHEVIKESAPTTLSKLELPVSSLMSYIPEIAKPLSLDNIETSLKNANVVIESWLRSTQETVRSGLQKSLQLITTVKGLHLIREESLKIELPNNWESICIESHLPDQFNVWYYFFQSLITDRCRSLISHKISMNVQDIQGYITDTLNSAIKSDKSEADLRWYVWHEENTDVSKVQNVHTGLSLKTSGYSQNIAGLCEKVDKRYLELLEDVSQYLYGQEYSCDINFSVIIKDYKFKRKYIDKDELENHLRIECTNNTAQITHFVNQILDKDSDEFVTKSIICARFFQAISTLCPNFNKCCKFNNMSDDWLRICDVFNRSSHILWQNWVTKSIEQMQSEVDKCDDISLTNMIRMLPRWDEIEIQEQTEEKVFKSKIKVPLKPSLILNNILLKLNNSLNCVLPHTLPKTIHLKFIERNVQVILSMYERLLATELNQIQALQFLFDVKYLAALCIHRENVQLVSYSQEICDKLRSRIDPFDLGRNNVKKSVFQSQMILGCVIPSSAQLASLGVLEKSKEQEQLPSVFGAKYSIIILLVPIITNNCAIPENGLKKDYEGSWYFDYGQKPTKTTPKKSQDQGSVVRQSAASLFGGLTTDWFS
ncbi:hypothetical protein NQ317_007180 [Molorchus minor]|uniref:Conserved oligomeric Golgi complex subunit 1 n=1 Tax=Molorchus minor TaxID=1323400 RepID=A0ABQ9J2J5_9CUCU|nr:hypothetical protein NQ317_007180 [Molorchus minor]